MSLVARHFEQAGLPTLILGSALDILQSGRPPRVAFVNYPLGFEAGRFRDREDQLAVVDAALSCFEMPEPGFHTLPFEWQDGWNLVTTRERGQGDQRSERSTVPQYQFDADRVAAEKAR